MAKHGHKNNNMQNVQHSHTRHPVSMLTRRSVEAPSTKAFSWPDFGSFRWSLTFDQLQEINPFSLGFG